LTSGAGFDLESLVTAGRLSIPFDALDARHRGRAGGKFGLELLQASVSPFDFDQYIPHLISDESGKTQAIGDSINEGAKADTLNDSLDGDGATLHFRQSSNGKSFPLRLRSSFPAWNGQSS
jgi:hypothetical protein